MARWRHNEWRRGSSSNIAGDDGMHVPDRFVCRNSVVEYHYCVGAAYYAGKAVGSTQRLQARLYAAGQDQANGPWDLEEGGGLGLEPQPGSVQLSCDLGHHLATVLHHHTFFHLSHKSGYFVSIYVT